MDFMFGLPKDCDGNTGIVVFADRLSKMAHLAAVPGSIDGKGKAMLFIDRVFSQNGLPLAIISDRDPRFTGKFGFHLQGAWNAIGHVHSGSSADRWSD